MENVPIKVTGDPLPADEFNNGLMTENKNAVESAGITLSGTDLDQLSKANSTYAAGSDFYQDSGVANAYVLNPPANLKSPVAYYEGQRVRFRVGNTNTTNATVQLPLLAVVPIVHINETPLGGGELEVNEYVELVFREAGVDSFFLVDSTNHASDDDYREGVINGSMTIAQRASLPTVPATLEPSPLDTYRVIRSATVTGGTVIHNTAAPLGLLGSSLRMAGVTTSAPATLRVVKRMEGALGAHYLDTNGRCSLQFLVLQNSGATLNYTMEMLSANTLNDFSASTQFTSGLSGNIAVQTGVVTKLTFENVIVPANAKNGIEIRTNVITPTMAVGRDFDFTDLQLNKGARLQSYRLNDAASDLNYAKRWVQKSYNDGVFLGTPTTDQQAQVALSAEDAFIVNNQTFIICPLSPSMGRAPLPVNCQSYSPFDGAPGTMRDIIDGVNKSAGTDGHTESTFTIVNSGTTSAQRLHSAHWFVGIDL